MLDICNGGCCPTLGRLRFWGAKGSYLHKNGDRHDSVVGCPFCAITQHGAEKHRVVFEESIHTFPWDIANYHTNREPPDTSRTSKTQHHVTRHSQHPV